LRIVENGREVARRESAEKPPTPGIRRTSVSARLTRLAKAVDFEWDASRAPVVMVRDLEQNRCIGFARGGYARISTSAPRLELLFSDGVHTHVQTWPGE
jgi:hypothetical protein